MFKGINVASSGFKCKDLSPTDNTSSNWKAIHLLQDFVNRNKVLVKYDKKINELWTTKGITQASSCFDDDNCNTSNQVDFGGSTISISQFSQSCLHDESDVDRVNDSDMETDINSTVNNTSKLGIISANHIIDMAREAAYACTTDTMRESSFRLIADFKHNNTCKADLDRSFMGAESSQTKGKEKRKRRQNDS